MHSSGTFCPDVHRYEILLLGAAMICLNSYITTKLKYIRIKYISDAQDERTRSMSEDKASQAVTGNSRKIATKVVE